MENNESKSLSPDEALQAVRSGRESAARRLATPWQWDAAIAASIGLFLGAIAYVTSPWNTVVMAMWLFSFLWLQQARRKSTGITADGETGRTFDAALLLVGGSVLAVFSAGMLVGARVWEGAPIVGAVVATAVAFLGYRWVSRRAVARALAAS